MIALAAIIHLPRSWIIGVSVAVIALQHARRRQVTGFGASVWRVLHQQGRSFHSKPGPVVFVMYPLVPWIAVMSAGYAGWLYRNPMTSGVANWFCSARPDPVFHHPSNDQRLR
jgi:uncharacterized membrane protein